MSTLPTGNIIVDGGTLSDLFFNHEHGNRNRLFEEARGANRGVTEDEEREALRADARSFVDCLAGRVPRDQEDALIDWLIADFAARV